MKFSYNWLAEHIDGLTVPPAEIGKLITMKTAECEGVEAHGAHFEHVVVARVLTAEPIPGTHLTVTSVDTGRYGVKQVVCGAPNCRAGMLTAYVPPGQLGVTTAKLRGVDSDGMLASAKELGISAEDEGIIEFAAGEPGAAMAGCTADTIVEIDNKSLTHRPDLWGHHGMAREVAAIAGRPLKPIAAELPAGAPAVEIEIRDAKLCPRFSALRFENVTVQPSPLWLQQRLESVGLNPINNIVDVTNYLMAELAQPMHAYDAAKLQGGRIIVRVAEEGELCPALNGQTYTLDAGNLVIADAGGPVGIAGVIGGGPSAIGEGTTTILLEAANFHAASIRRTSTKLKLRTDASMRFEKSQDPENTVRALARAKWLLEQVSPGIRLVGGLADDYHPLPAVAPIEFDLVWMRRKLGKPDLTAAEVTAILRSLAFGVAEAEGRFTVTVPSWRATKDVSLKDDLVEEVGRMIGYGNLTPAPPLVPSVVPPLPPERSYLRGLRQLLTAQGYTEVYNYSFVNEAQAAELGLPLEDHVRVVNPIAQGQELLRTSLLPNIKRNINDNAREFESFRCFEIGKEIHARGRELPEEIPHLAAVSFDKHGDGAANLFELKRLAGTIAPGCTVEPAEARGYEHPNRAAIVILRNEAIGRLFEFHPAMVETGRAAVLDLDLTKVQALRTAAGKYKPLRRFPTSAFDVTVPVAERELAGNVLARLREGAGGLALDIRYLYDYKGDSGRSMSFRITLGAADRTLTGEEVTAVRSQVMSWMGLVS
ncbi:MAG: phenylalanine--tRNA ligase subunit beta [Acidobacteriota bacterium]